MLLEGVILMFVGMGAVFIFLLVLIGATLLSSKIIRVWEASLAAKKAAAEQGAKS